MAHAADRNKSPFHDQKAELKRKIQLLGKFVSYSFSVKTWVYAKTIFFS